MSFRSHSAGGAIVPKFDMHTFFSTMTVDEVNSMAEESRIPLDLHPRAPSSTMTMNNLPADAIGLVPQGQKASDYDNSDPVPPRQNVVPTAEKTDSSHQGLEFLFNPLLEEYYNPTHGQAEENNNDQAPNASLQEDEFINPFCTQRSSIRTSSWKSNHAWIEAMQDELHQFGRLKSGN
ncbi:hypothetical protein Tco_0349506 [Tanacetum coccineum]